MAVTFGTDGVRGRAYDVLRITDAFAIGGAAAAVLTPVKAVIAHDSRESGEDFVRALAIGLERAGVTVSYLGVAPTPAVAHLARLDSETGIRTIGVMVSASHNPWFDNGIKIFAPGGCKLSDDQQAAMEALLADASTQDAELPNGSVTDLLSAEHRMADYTTALAATVPSLALAGLKVVIDAANGASSHMVGPVFADLGADVVLLSNRPSGRNINEDCGSTHPESLVAAVLREGADLGLALDGDADRLVAVDHTGAIVGGDEVIAVCAIDRAGRDLLAGNTVVVTVMTNLGFRQAMDERGIAVAETAVGDRHVLEALDANGWTLGGEQSGHVIFRDLATTGDGVLTGIQLAETVARTQRSLHDLATESMTRLPQVLENVQVATRVTNVAEELAEDIASVEAALGTAGRVLVRASGTEPVIRVMVEAPTAELAARVCRQLVERVQARFGSVS